MLFDVHAHLTSPHFQDDVAAVIARARAAGVTTIISNGLNREDNERVRDLAALYPEIRPAFGLYPVDAVLPQMVALGIEYPRERVEVESAELTVQWLEKHVDEAFAIGEIGLDHHWVPPELWPEQERVFRHLVGLAMEANKPIIVHTRKAEARTLEILLEMGARRVDWHCFSSRLKLARRIAEAGHYLSVPSNARRSETFTGLLRDLPRDCLLLETDCPYLPPNPGQRNEPSTVRGTAEYAAELWGVDLATVTKQFSDNFARLFETPP